MFELGALRMIQGGQLNPQWFGHPATTTMYLLALIDVAVLALGLLTGRFAGINEFVAAIYSDPGILVLPHRIAITLIAVLCIALAYRLATQLFDQKTALVTAAILAVSPVHITYSQIVRSDMMATTFMLAAMLFALSYAREGKRSAFIGTVIFVALAITTKWPFALSLLALVGALGLRWRGGLLTGKGALLLLWTAAAGTLVAMLLISPFLLIEIGTVIANLHGEVQVHHLGATGGGPLSNAWWYASVPFMRALGSAGLALATIGLWHARKHSQLIAIVLLPSLAIYCLASSQNIVWERWVLALVPILAMLAAYALVCIATCISERCSVLATGAAATVLFATVTVPLIAAAKADGKERMNDTRLMASAWLRQHAQPGSKILVEHFAFDLVDSPFDFVFPLGSMGCKDARELLGGRVDNSMIESARNGRTNIDYGTVEPAFLSTCRSDYAVLSQHSRYFAEKGRFPSEYAIYRRLLDEGQNVAEFHPRRGEAGGWPVVILRFKNEQAK